ncbi:hypothetical protein AB5I41_17770 [Sphingomonas sp. MMS24-JH45]
MSEPALLRALLDGAGRLVEAHPRSPRSTSEQGQAGARRRRRGIRRAGAPRPASRHRNRACGHDRRRRHRPRLLDRRRAGRECRPRR